MKKIQDLIAELNENDRQKVENTIDMCMKGIVCDDVNWKQFNVNASAIKAVRGMIAKMEISFLITIADKAKQEQKKDVTIFCTSTKENKDTIWFVNVNTTELHAIINLSSETKNYLTKAL